MVYSVPVKAVVFPREENGQWPLPPDYHELSPEGQRQARVNACCMRASPEDFVAAWEFFRRHYLFTLPPGMWYGTGLVESPPAHYAMVHDMAAYPRNLWAMPRAFAKSLLLLEMILLLLLTRPYFPMLLIKSIGSLVYEAFGLLMEQMEENGRIVSDFGDLKPKRGGSGSWNHARLKLNNKASLSGRSISGQLLGSRPMGLFCDDVEFDPVLQTCPAEYTDAFVKLIFNHMVPMLDPGAFVTITGTLLTRKAFLYHMATVSVAEDPRMRFWNRVVLAGEDEEGESTWEQKFPKERLDQMKEELGAAAFSAQVGNKPISEDTQPFRIHPVLGQYSIQEKDERLEADPLNSKATLLSYRVSGLDPKTGEPVCQEVKRPFGETAQKMYRILLADPIRKPSGKSDFATAMVLGRENTPGLYRDTYWVLDFYMARVGTSQLVDKLMELGTKWWCRVVGVENIGLKTEIQERMRGDLLERAARSGWMPRFQWVKYTGGYSKIDKGMRIMGVAWRFEQHLFKFPADYAAQDPWRALYYQVANFTPDLGLLPFDDAVDTLSMIQFVIKPRGLGGSRVEEGPLTPMQMMERGMTYVPGTKLPLYLCVDPAQMTPKAQQALARKVAGLDRGKKRKPRRGDSPQKISSGFPR